MDDELSKVMTERKITIAARTMSILFTPFYLPIVGLVALLIFSYLSILPLAYKLKLLLLVYLFTVLIPTVLIRIYRIYQGRTRLDIGQKEQRMVPYLISILCYFACYYIMEWFHIPHIISIVLLIALLIQVLCAVINVWWKISTHTAAIGGVAGGLMAFSLIFSFNPVWWLSLVIIVAGMVGTSRIILRQHTLSQVIAGFLLGLLCAFFLIIRF